MLMAFSGVSLGPSSGEDLLFIVLILFNALEPLALSTAASAVGVMHSILCSIFMALLTVCLLIKAKTRVSRSGDSGFWLNSIPSDSFMKSDVSHHTSYILDPSRDTFSFSECSNKYIGSFVAVLLNMRSKLTVIWLIVAVVIFTFYGQSGFIPILDSPRFKRFEIMEPRGMHDYASAAVVPVLLCRREIASLLNTAPYIVQQNVFSSYQMSPPCDFQIGVGGASSGVASIPGGFDGRPYPLDKNNTKGVV